MRKELRTRGIHHLKVVFSPEKPVSPAQPEAPPPGRRSVPASNPWVPATAGLLLGSAVVRDLMPRSLCPDKSSGPQFAGRCFMESVPYTASVFSTETATGTGSSLPSSPV